MLKGSLIDKESAHTDKKKRSKQSGLTSQNRKQNVIVCTAYYCCNLFQTIPGNLLFKVIKGI